MFVYLGIFLGSGLKILCLHISLKLKEYKKRERERE